MAEDQIIPFLVNNRIGLVLLTAIIIGLIQGHYLGKRTLADIDKRRKRVKWISAGFVILFIVIMYFNLDKFINPTQISGTFALPADIDGVVLVAQNFVSERGVYGIVSMILPSIMVFFRKGQNERGLVLKFMKITGLVTTGAILAVTVFNFTPDQNTIMIFAAYQIFMVIGAITSLSRYIIR